MNKNCLVFLLLVLLFASVRSSPYAVPPLDPANYVLFTEDGCWIPVDYYNSSPIIPSDMSLERWLNLITWNKKYKAHAFDCSQMSAFLEWIIDNAGHRVHFLIGYGHCWLAVKIDGEWELYETVTLEWVSEEMDERYVNPQITLTNLYDVMSWYQRAVWAGRYTKADAETAFLQEFGWWIQEEE